MTELPAHAVQGQFEEVATIRGPGGAPFHPQQHVGDPEIIKVDGVFHLFMSIGVWPQGMTIYHATANSIEGPYTHAEPVLRPGVGGPGNPQGDAQACETFSCAELPRGFRGAAERSFVGLYAGGNGYFHPSKHMTTHRASTIDSTLAGWTKYGRVTAPELEWEQGYQVAHGATYTVGAENTLAIADDNVHIHALFSSLSKWPSGWNRSIGWMTSPNAGASWLKHPLPVMAPDRFQGFGFYSQPCLRNDARGGWHCWYARGVIKGGPQEARGICHAWSPDLVNWHQDPNNPVVPKNPSPIELTGSAGAPSAIWENGRWHIIYHRKRGTKPNAGEILLAREA